MDNVVMRGSTEIRFHSRPRVFLVASSAVAGSGDNGLSAFMNEHGLTRSDERVDACDYLPELAGRLCYMSFANPRPGGNKAYLEHIKEARHGSVLEHSVWSFIFTGISRSLSHELVRHRAGMSFSQLSQRYVDESVAEYVVPPAIFQAAGGRMTTTPDGTVLDANGKVTTLGAAWLQSIVHSHDAYCTLVGQLVEQARLLGLVGTDGRKYARQAARSVLPNATETKIMVTGNGRSWRHFIEQRGSRFADAEIRLLANAVYDVLKVEAPNLFSDYVAVELHDGSREISTAYQKV